jgi:nucleotide-binding universal stress UspA family protein
VIFVTELLVETFVDFVCCIGKEMNQMSESIVIKSMPAFNRVLAATDFSAASGAAFQVALNVCSELGASLFVLHVFEPVASLPKEAANQLLDSLLQRARELGVTCEVLVESGTAPLKILDTIANKEIDLVTLGTNAPKGLGRLLSGSTAEEVLRKAPCPVLTVGPKVAATAAKIEGPVVFATDFKLTTIDAIRYAASFSQVAGSSLHCLHVIPHTVDSAERSRLVPQIMSDALQHIVSERGTKIKMPICVTTYGNEISDAIVDFARRERAKLIVLGVRKASMAAAHVPSHLAYRIIAEAPCPVMTIAFAPLSHEIPAVA